MMLPVSNATGGGEKNPQKRSSSAPDADDTSVVKLQDSLSSGLLRVMWTLRQSAVHAFESQGLRLVQAVTLFYIAQGHTRPKALAEALGIHPAALSTLLRELETSALIKRSTDDVDKRKVDVQLTDKGKLVLEKLEKSWLTASGWEALKLDAAELSRLVHLIQTLSKHSA
jgi:DNA-binding MarR family transcriptional regulator